MNRKMLQKLLLLSVVLVGLLWTSAFSFVPRVAAADGFDGEVALDSLNLRAGPGFGSKILRQLEEGQDVIVLGRSLNSYWLQVRLADGMGGWVYASYILMDAGVNSLPVTEASGGPLGSSGNNPAVLGIYLTISDDVADLKLENFPKSKGIVVEMGLPVKGTDLEIARGVTDAGGRLTLSFEMPEEWSNGKPVTQNHLLLEVSTSDGKVHQSIDVVYYP